MVRFGRAGPPLKHIDGTAGTSGRPPAATTSTSLHEITHTPACLPALKMIGHCWCFIVLWTVIIKPGQLSVGDCTESSRVVVSAFVSPDELHSGMGSANPLSFWLFFGSSQIILLEQGQGTSHELPVLCG